MRTRIYIGILLLAFVAMVPNAAYAGFGAAIVSIFGFFTGIAGWLLNTSIDYTILKIADTIRFGGLGSIIEEMWKIVRDLVNLTLVFGLLYAGFQTIVKGIDASHVKEILKNIIICALLVNFSLIFTKVIIDVSNSASVAIYNQIITQNDSAILNGNDWNNYGISGAFMHAMGLATFLDAGGLDTEKYDEDDGFMYAVVGIIFMIIAAFVFFAGAIMLMTRFAVLILLMIFSPILFAASAFKQTAEWRSWWIKSMTDQAIFPPVYLFMLWISYMVMFGLFRGVQSDSLSKIISKPETVVDMGTSNPVLGFILGAILLVASLIAAKKAGAVGGDMATKFAGRMAFGSMGALGRVTVGKRSYETYQKNQKTWTEQSSQSGLRGYLAMGKLALTKKGATSSYDVRATKIGAQMGKYGGKDALQLGDAHEGGYEANRNEYLAESKRKADALGKVDDKDPLVLARKSVVHSEEEALEEIKRDQKQKMDDLNSNRKELAKEKAEIPKTISFNEKAIIDFQKKVALARVVAVQKQAQKQQLKNSGASTADVAKKDIEIQDELTKVTTMEQEIKEKQAQIETLRQRAPVVVDEYTAKEAEIKLTSASHRSKLHEKSEAVSKAKEAVEREKNRNQIGRAATSFEAATTEYKELEEQIHVAKESIEGERGYAHKLAHAKDKADQEVLIKNIKDTQKQIEALEIAQNDYVRKAKGGSLWSGTSNGYADVASFEGYNPAVQAAYAFVTGTDRATLKAAGKHIRKEWTSSAPAKKGKKSSGGDSHAAPAPAAHPPAAGGGDGHH